MEQVREEILYDLMAKGNIKLELNTVRVVDRCVMLWTSSKPYYVYGIMWPKFLDRRTCFGMIWESLNKG
jgi:hypothetical protein